MIVEEHGRPWRVGPHNRSGVTSTKYGLKDAMAHALTLLSRGTPEVQITAPNGRDMYVVRKK